MSANPQTNHKPGRDQELLKLFLGSWKVEGHNAPSAPDAQGDPVTGQDIFDLLEGGFFIRGAWDHKFSSGQHTGIAMMGYDADEKTLFSHHYDNLGYPRQYDVTYADRVFTYSGPHERAKFTFSADGKRMDQTWEMSEDGKTWKPLCELRLTKES